MNFLLGPEQHEMQRAVARYLDECIDTVELHKHFDDDSELGGHDPQLFAGLAELGIFGVNLPEALGGLGLEMLDLALIAETIGSRAAPVPFLGHALATLAIAWAGSDAQRERWLPSLLDGSVIASVGFVTEGGSWDPASWDVTPSERISGEWPHVPGAHVAQLFLLGLAGGQLALVERATNGVNVTPLPSTDRTRRIGTVRLQNSLVEVLPSTHAHRLREAALILLAADAFGGATRCHEMATAYAKERVQFGQPIGRFQAVKHQIADMVIAVEPARGLYWYAAHAFDHRAELEAEQMAALAKAHLADLYVYAARCCIEVHGGMGYTWELDSHIFLRRAMFDYAWMGQPAQHHARAADLAGW